MSEHEIRTNICITHGQHVSYCLAAAERRTKDIELRYGTRCASLPDRGDAACCPVLVPIPDHLWEHGIFEFDPSHPEYGIDSEGRKCIAADVHIVPALRALWDAGIVTRSSCCGHGSGWALVSIFIDCVAVTSPPEPNPKGA